MTTSAQHKAKIFRELSTQGHLLLPNAWDAASARIFEEAGFPAIGTTSAGIAYSRGFRDAQQISREAMMREVAIIASGHYCQCGGHTRNGRYRSRLWSLP